MIDFRREAGRQLARNTAAPPELLRRLAAIGDTHVLASLGMRGDVPADVVPKLVAACLTVDFATVSVLLHYNKPGVPEELAKSDDPKIRAAVVEAMGVMEERRRKEQLMRSESGWRTLLADPDPRVRLQAMTATGIGMPNDRYAKLPVDLMQALLADPDPVTRWKAASVVKVPTLSDRTVEELVTDADDRLRAAVAGNASLPAEQVERLALDREEGVRAAVLLNPATPHKLRLQLYPTIDTGYWRHIMPNWLYAPLSALPGKLEFVHSPFVPFRRAVACDPELPPEAVAVLAADDDFLVRHLLCEHHPNPPPDLMERIVLESKLITRGDIFVRPAFPVDALRRFAESPEVRRRCMAAGHPRLPPDVAEMLSLDDEPEVRKTVAGNPNLSGQALVQLINSGDHDAVVQACRNPNLPVGYMFGLMDQLEA